MTITGFLSIFALTTSSNFALASVLIHALLQYVWKCVDNKGVPSDSSTTCVPTAGIDIRVLVYPVYACSTGENTGEYVKRVCFSVMGSTLAGVVLT